MWRTALRRVLGSAVLVAFGLAGSCGDEPGCVDQDEDGRGEGCELGPDCDDTNPLRNDDCEAVAAPDCAEDPTATGCPCLPSGNRDCFPGPEESIGVGLCVAGNTRCINGYWGICEGALGPRSESCDEEDNDCDGEVDEGVLSPCGACTPGCIGGVWGDGVEPFEAGGALALTDGGQLTLRRDEVLSSEVWVANSAEGTLSRIDAERAEEIGRYLTGGTEPSRVAIDYRGDAWVANREFDGVSSIRKIASDEERCIDRNDSGAIDTSDGSTVLAEGEDECVLLTAEVGESGGVARALAIDGNLGLDGVSGGDVWVGLHDAEAVLQLDGNTGEVLDRIETPGFSPYMATFDPWGTLWLISRDGYLASIDRRAAEREVVVREVPLPCFLLYGLASDPNGRLALTGFGCDRVTTYNPVTDIWRTVTTPPSVRGAVVTPQSMEGDDPGELWVAHTGGSVSRLRIHPLALLETFELIGEGAAPLETIGIGIDALGHVWAASSQSDLSTGVATRVELSSGAVSAQVPVGLAPHTQGDLTGAKRLGGFVEEGQQSHIFRGCAFGDTNWLRVHLAASPGATGTVLVEARRAESEHELTGVELVRVGEIPTEPAPFELDLAPGGVVEVRITLRTSSRDGAPRVRRVGLEWMCPGPG